jgi:hypothetical protein
MIVETKCGERTAPALIARGRPYLVCRATDHGEDAVVVLAGGTAEVGVEPSRSELGSRERQAHIVLAAGLAAPDPASTDLDALGDDPVWVGFSVLRRQICSSDHLRPGIKREAGTNLALNRVSLSEVG